MCNYLCNLSGSWLIFRTNIWRSRLRVLNKKRQNVHDFLLFPNFSVILNNDEKVIVGRSITSLDTPNRPSNVTFRFRSRHPGPPRGADPHVLSRPLRLRLRTRLRCDEPSQQLLTLRTEAWRPLTTFALRIVRSQRVISMYIYVSPRAVSTCDLFKQPRARILLHFRVAAMTCMILLPIL